MKTITPILAASALSLAATLHVTAQDNSTHELNVVNQLTTKAAVASLPISQFLNAPGNEALKAFFFTPVKDTTLLKGKRIAVLAADGFEEIELTGPAWYFRALGAQVDIVSPKFNPAPARYGLSTPDMAKEWNPDNLRHDKDVVRFLQDFNKSGKLIAAICHGPVVLASADLLKGKKLTGYWNIQIDLKNAGGEVLEQAVVVDGNLITSRHPIDVADFSLAVRDWLTAR